MERCDKMPGFLVLDSISSPSLPRLAGAALRFIYQRVFSLSVFKLVGLVKVCKLMPCDHVWSVSAKSTSKDSLNENYDTIEVTLTK